MRTITRACGLLAILVPLALGAACSDPELASELDTEGAPEVLEVNVRSETAPTDPNGNAIEAATYCRPGDEFAVSVFYCPLERDSENKPIQGDREVDSPIMDATPIGWHVRVIFAELLDPDVEDLVEVDGVITGSLAGTQPFTLRCGGVDIEYDGWYDPTGNFLSYPPGPSLVATPIDFIASGTADCEIEVGDVIDKDGDAVPSDQRGPYAFGIAALSVQSDPEDAAEGIDPAAPIVLQFNAPIDLATVADRITVNDGTADVTFTVNFLTDPKTGEVSDESAVVVTPDAPLTAATMYTVTVDAGIADIAGGPLNEAVTFTFTTGEGA